MKILFTSVIDIKKSQHNRPHQFLKYLCQKHEITLLCINDWWKAEQFDYDNYSNDFNYIYDKINFNYLTDRKISPFMQEILFKKKVKQILKTNKFDAHLNYNSLIMGYEAAKSVNTVFDLADDLIAMIRSSPQIPLYLKYFGSLLGNNYIKNNITISKKITVTNEILAGKFQIPVNKKEIIPNGVDTNLFSNTRKNLTDLKINGFIIGYVGVLREWVNFEPLFKILNLLGNDVKVLIVGKEGRYDQTVDLAKKYNVLDKVIFTGNIPYSMIPKYISLMDICLIPFDNQQISQSALPLKLFEYMSCNKPIISTEIPSIKNIAGDMVLFSSTPQNLLEKILILYNDRKLRIKMGNEGRTLVEKFYSWDTITNNLNNILSKIDY